MSRLRLFLAPVISTLMLLVLAGPTLAVDRPDTTRIFFNPPKVDTKSEFAVTGTITEIDRSDPPSFYAGSDLITVTGTNWNIQFVAIAVGWKIPPGHEQDGARGYKFAAFGIHIDGPHDLPGPPVDTDPDTSDVVETDKANFYWGKSGTVSKVWREEHETNVPNKPHWDIYGFKSEGKAVKGPDHMVNGTIGIAAKHTDDKTVRSIPVALVMGSSPGSGAYVSYDAGTAMLTVHMGALDILNSVGSLSPGIEPDFVDDPILDTQADDVSLLYLGPTGDGGYRFGGGHTSILDFPDSTLIVDGNFAEYLIFDTSLSGTIDSYALHDSMSAGNTGTCSSPFYDGFTDVNFLGDDVPSPEWLERQGISLEFVTPVNLAVITAGFTASAFNVPATVAISGSRRDTDALAVPEDTQGMIPNPAQGHPNPFADRSTLHYQLAEAGPVRIEVFDPAGRLVRRLLDLPSQAPGEYTAVWDGSSATGKRVAAGVYYYRVTLAGRTWTRDVVLVR